MSTLRNSVRLTGFLGGAPEERTFGEDKSLARVSIATNERYRDQQGEWHTNTQWHSLVFWDGLAKYAVEHLQKGTEVSIEGKLVNSQYVDKEGVTRYSTEVKVNEVLALGKRGE